MNELLLLLYYASIMWCLCSVGKKKKKNFWKIVVIQDSPMCFTGSRTRAGMDIFSSLCAQDCFAFGIWESCAGANSGGQKGSECLCLLPFLSFEPGWQGAGPNSDGYLDRIPAGCIIPCLLL